MHKLLILAAFVFSSNCLLAQSKVKNPVSWTATVESTDQEDEVLVKITAKMDGQWAIYSQFTEEGGPVPTSFHFPKTLELVGGTEEITSPIKKFDELFEAEVIKFLNVAEFQQKIKKPVDGGSHTIEVVFMCCNAKTCLPPTTKEITVAFE